jgi:hypothetical protein
MGKSNQGERWHQMWRWQRREKKQEAKKARMPKHGKGMMQFYANAILKRLKGQKKKSS